MNEQNIDYIEIVENIETELNDIAESYGVPFRFEVKIVSNIYIANAVQVLKKDVPILRGVFVPSPGDIVPIQGLYSFTSGANLMFVCGDEYKNEAFDILNTWTVQAAGKSGVITDTNNNGIAYTMSTNTPSVGAETQIPGVGQGVTFGTILGFQFVKGGAIGNACIWELDGNPLTDLSSTITKTRTTNADQRENDECLTNVAISQSLTFKFTLPYINSPAISALVQEMLSTGQLDKKHNLSYYDNVAIPEANKVTFTVFAQAIAQNNQKGSVSTIEAVFVLTQEE